MPTSSRVRHVLALAACSLAALAAERKPIDPANLDTSVQPCVDFYQYANGGWLKANPVPPDQARWGSFEELAARNREVVRAILQEVSARKDWPKGTIQQKVADFYASGMDEEAIEKAGTGPLKPWLAKVERLHGGSGLPSLLADLRLHGLGHGFAFLVAPDPKDSTRMILHLNQGGLGLPDRDYYLKSDPKSQELRAKYRAHVARMLALAGEDPSSAAASAASVLEVETRLAAASLTRVENRDPQKTTHKMTLGELERVAPGFGWRAFFAALGVAEPGDLNVRQPAFCTAFGELAATLPPEQWRSYCRWHLASGMAAHLTRAFQEESFAFQGRTLQGQPKLEERWKRVQAAADRSLGDALGQLYVARAFPPEAKAKMLDLVENLRAALRTRIEQLDWMGPQTKAQALRKLAAFGVKVGYPERWKDYAKLEISRTGWAGNLLRARRFEVQRNLAKLGRPIDRTEWNMTPPTVNAYYSPSMNEIVFPAGILQPPFFDPKADDAVNYGGIGCVIGHEMSHGFDDSGSQYDAEGNLKNWWTVEDRKAYEARTSLMVKQYDGYEALPGEHLNGRLTLGENIGDLGGIKIALAGLQRAQERGGKAAPIDGFSAEQRFFLNWAQVWRNNIRDEELRRRVNTDPHSPGRFRVLGPLADLPEFHRAFGCAEGAPMVRNAADRPAIW